MTDDLYMCCARARLHKVVEEVGVAVLVAAHLHVVLGVQIVVHVLLLPLLACVLLRLLAVVLLL